MATKKPTAIYRLFFRDAWSLAWKRKSLWVFGIFAALLQSGGLGDTLLRGLRRVEYRGEWFSNALQNSLPGLRPLGTYLSHIATLPSWQTVLFVSLVFGVLFVLFLLSIISQIILMRHADLKTTPATWSWYEWVEGVERLIGIHVCVKIIGFLATLLTTLVLILYLQAPSTLHAFFVFLSLGLLFPTLIILQNLSMLASLHAVHAKEHLLSCLAHALTLFRSHWLASVELGVSVFLLVAGLAMFTGFALLLLLFPIAFLALFFLSAGSWIGFFLCQGTSLLTVLVAAFVFVGWTTVFQYAVWTLFYKRASQDPWARRPIARLLRWMEKR
jgi:hypothetical protein